MVSSHREENVDTLDKLEELVSILNTLVEKYDHPIVFSTHPRTRNQLKKIKITPNPKIQFLEPLDKKGYFTQLILGCCSKDEFSFEVGGLIFGM